ncbi:LysR family transcriptional regulator [Nocardioides sp. NBC_00163]|uniref:LysR family transcriptional regulator n=1 Tax=unclassified Nocardioides TaxID=2615069 RepID=UPI00325256B0
MRVERAIYFVEAVRAGSLRAAANRLQVTQSVLGEQITALEEELDTHLLRRTRQGVVLTSAGAALLPRAEELIAAQRALLDAASTYSHRLVGRVRVGANPILAALLLTPVVAEIRSQHMGVRVQVIDGPSGDILDRVTRGLLDLAVLSSLGGTVSGQLRREAVAVTPMAIYVLPGHELYDRSSVSWHEIAPWPLISMRRDTTLGEGLAAGLPTANVVAEVSSIYHIVTMVDAGIGVGVGVPANLPGVATAGAWVPIQGEGRIVSEIVYRADSPLDRPAQLVRDALRERAKGLG